MLIIIIISNVIICLIKCDCKQAALGGRIVRSVISGFSTLRSVVRVLNEVYIYE